MAFASPRAAMAFYGEVINEHCFDDLLPVLSAEVVFWFSSGSHFGIDAARQAFEGTWSRIVSEHYWLEDMRWLSEGESTASCIYRFRWRGLIAGIPTEGGGRGTTVLCRERSGWVIAHEHLSAEPKSSGPPDGGPPVW